MASIKLKPVRPWHARILYRALERRPDASRISHIQMPPYFDHLCFVWRYCLGLRLPNGVKYRRWWLVYRNDVIAGVGYATSIGEIAVNPAFVDWSDRESFCFEAIGAIDYEYRFLFGFFNKLFVNVAVGDDLMKRVAGHLGYSLVQVTYGRD